jgi:hypothetical protein
VPANVVISDNTIDGSDVPSAVTVETLKLYGVSGFKPVTVAEPLVIEAPVLTHGTQLKPSSEEYSITASVTAGSSIQERSTEVEVILVADRSVGAGGGVTVPANVVIPDNTADGSDIPSAVTVETRKLYGVSGVKPVTVAEPLVMKTSV